MGWIPKPGEPLYVVRWLYEEERTSIMNPPIHCVVRSLAVRRLSADDLARDPHVVEVGRFYYAINGWWCEVREPTEAEEAVWRLS